MPGTRPPAPAELRGMWLQGQASSGHRLGSQGAQHGEGGERQRQSNVRWIKNLMFMLF